MADRILPFDAMSHEPDSPASTAVTPSAHHPTTAEVSSETPRPAVYCNLTDDQTFMPYLVTRAHVPVLANFGAGSLHMCTVHGSWDLERAISEQAALLRSVHWCSADGKPPRWDDLTFRFGPRAFLYADDTRIIGYAATPQEAKELVAKFGAAYQRPPEPTGGAFHLIRNGREISSEIVPLGAETVLDEETFRLHYGADGWTWHEDYAAKLRTSHHGLAIFEGSPGTGKTSYLRHLMGVLRDSHRFYFVPPATLNVLSSPDFVGFWAEQRRRHPRQRFVVILEDADGALMIRDTDNRAHVSAILNLSDGMLADFLRLQIICTINGRAAEIDQALLRPGRLLCHRLFGRMDLTHAHRLAKRLGRSLPRGDDFSLAEVYADGDRTENFSTHPRFGFGA